MTGSKRTILLVEDEPAQSLLTQFNLEQAGFNVIPASSGEEAIETASAKAGQIDLIIMDIDLGSDLDGIESAEIILASFDLPLLFLSSHTDPELVTRTETVSSYGYVIKGSFPVLLASVKMAFQLYEANQKLKQQEKLLKEREFWLNRSQNAASIGSFEINFLTGIWSCSLGLYKVFGVEENICLDMDAWAAAIHPEDREITVDYFSKVLTDRSIFEKDYRIIRKCDGAVRWIHGVGEIETGTEGNLTKMYGIIQDITERKIAGNKLKNSERKYRDLFENNPEPTLIFDSESLKILDINYAAVKKYGYTKNEFKELTILQLRPEEEWNKLLEHLVSGKVQRNKPGIWLHKKKNGELIFAEVTSSDTDYEGRKARIVVAADVTERLKAEEKIKDSLKEKEILLSEIHHRVKNNLQVISSMLSLQADYISDAGTREHFRNSTNRIRTMALIHEKLYQSNDFSRIDIKEYLTDLTAFLFRSSVLSAGRISLNITGKNFNMPLDNAIPCGLIVNELVSNSLKYAFADNEEGSISMSINLSGKTATLIFSDTGKGLPADLDISKTETLGLQLVHSLVRQLNGKIEIINSNGLTFILAFDLK